jgi:hypothetical protein
MEKLTCSAFLSEAKNLSSIQMTYPLDQLSRNKQKERFFASLRMTAFLVFSAACQACAACSLYPTAF